MRPIGGQIRAMLEASDRIGIPAHSSEIAHLCHPPVHPTSFSRTARRAVAYGLMECFNTEPPTFQSAPDWKTLIQRRVSRRWSGTTTEAAQAPRKIINSVWSMGA